EDLDTAGQQTFLWTDDGSGGRGRVDEVFARIYLVGRGDIDTDGDGIPDARETMVHGTDPAVGRTTVFTSPTFIGAADLMYEGDTIVVDGTTLTINGTHFFAHLILTNGAALNHTAGHPGGVTLCINGSVLVDPGSSIDVSGLGEAAPLATLPLSGGSYGGLGFRLQPIPGGVSATPSNPGYGSYLQPADLGTGGFGTLGGGAVRLKAETLVLDGTLRADGTDGVAPDSGGGSGGSIWLEVDTLTGAGRVSAVGGDKSPASFVSGAGGGGRIALYVESTTGFDLDNNIDCMGGTHGVLFLGSVVSGGGAGTIFIHDTGSAESVLQVDNRDRGNGGPGTEIGRITAEVDELKVAGARCSVSNVVPLAGLVLTNAAVLTYPVGSSQGLDLTVNGTVLVSTNSAIDVSGRGNEPTIDVTGSSGGSYGGRGVENLGGSNPTYGNYLEPTDPGTGGHNPATFMPVHARGGGVLKVDAETLILNGQLLANGQDGTGQAGNPNSGGGSGGSIWVVVDTLSGVGGMGADGGATLSFGPGGGGRVAVYYADASGFDVSSVHAFGGTRFGPGGGAGTVYLRDTDESLGRLRVDNEPNGLVGERTDLGLMMGTLSRLDVADARVVVEETAELGNVVITGSVVTVDEASWSVTNSVTLQSSVLSPAIGGGTALHLVVGGTLSVDAGSSIDASGRGLVAPSNVTGRSGGSYGGRGEEVLGSSNPTYGDFLEPADVGSGGTGNASTLGGGALRIQADELLLDGQILADGEAGPAQTGGGSGGSIWVDVRALHGNGSMSANGGAEGSSAGAGGGGRIAVYYHERTGPDPVSSITCAGGASDGGAGTIFLKDKDEARGLLRVDNGAVGNGGLPTPLAIGASVISGLDIAGARVFIPQPPSLPSMMLTDAVVIVESALWTVTNDFTLSGASILTHTPGAGNRVYLQVGGTLTIGPNAALDVTGVGALPTAAVTGRSGGSHGGRGEESGGSSNPAYGDFIQPTDVGTGGAGSLPTFGGGALRLEADTLVLDGQLRADGESGPTSTGGGSGGSIWVDVRAIGGAGTMSANGGAQGSSGGAGGGGRIAI
ncbi:MAG: hypothetical protein AAF492_04160, partial [Verrucomicrobiota bacterium]